MSGINFIAPLNDSSYGICGRELTKSLYKKLGDKLSLFPIHNIDISQESNEAQLAIANSRLYDFNAPSVRLWHQDNMTMFTGKGKRIGWPIFELNKFNKVEHHHLSSCDELVVCSKWAKNIIKENGIDVPCHVVPLGVDTSIFNPAPNNNGPTIFLNVAKWEKRKLHDKLSEAFRKAFSPNDDVMLFMLPSNPFLTMEEKFAWESLYKFPKIRILPRLTRVRDLVKLYQSAHCVVGPSRAEGWNLGLLEAMACGKHVICTNYSGHTEFCNSQNSLLIDSTELEVAQDNKWFFGQGEWMKFGDVQEEQLINHMRYIHELNKNKELGMNVAGIETAKTFTWDNSAEKLIHAIN